MLMYALSMFTLCYAFIANHGPWLLLPLASGPWLLLPLASSPVIYLAFDSVDADVALAIHLMLVSPGVTLFASSASCSQPILPPCHVFCSFLVLGLPYAPC